MMLDEAVRQILPVDRESAAKAQIRLDGLTKPSAAWGGWKKRPYGTLPSRER